MLLGAYEMNSIITWYENFLDRVLYTRDNLTIVKCTLNAFIRIILLFVVYKEKGQTCNIMHRVVMILATSICKMSNYRPFLCHCIVLCCYYHFCVPFVSYHTVKGSAGKADVICYLLFQHYYYFFLVGPLDCKTISILYA